MNLFIFLFIFYLFFYLFLFPFLKVRQEEKKKRRNQFSDHFFSSYFDDDDDDTNLNEISLTRSEVNDRNLQLEVEREIELYNDVTIALLDQNRDDDVNEVESSDSEDDYNYSLNNDKKLDKFDDENRTEVIINCSHHYEDVGEEVEFTGKTVEKKVENEGLIRGNDAASQSPILRQNQISMRSDIDKASKNINENNACGKNDENEKNVLQPRTFAALCSIYSGGQDRRAEIERPFSYEKNKGNKEVLDMLDSRGMTEEGGSHKEKNKSKINNNTILKERSQTIETGSIGYGVQKEIDGRISDNVVSIVPILVPSLVPSSLSSLTVKENQRKQSIESMRSRTRDIHSIRPSAGGSMRSRTQDTTSNRPSLYSVQNRMESCSDSEDSSSDEDFDMPTSVSMAGSKRNTPRHSSQSRLSSLRIVHEKQNNLNNQDITLLKSDSDYLSSKEKDDKSPPLFSTSSPSDSSLKNIDSQDQKQKETQHKIQNLKQHNQDKIHNQLEGDNFNFNKTKNNSPSHCFSAPVGDSPVLSKNPFGQSPPVKTPPSANKKSLHSNINMINGNMNNNNKNMNKNVKKKESRRLSNSNTNFKNISYNNNNNNKSESISLNIPTKNSSPDAWQKQFAERMKKIETRKKVYSVALRPPVPSSLPVPSLVSSNAIESPLPYSLPYPTSLKKIIVIRKNGNNDKNSDTKFQANVIEGKKGSNYCPEETMKSNIDQSNWENMEIDLNDQRNHREKKNGTEINVKDSHYRSTVINDQSSHGKNHLNKGTGYETPVAGQMGSNLNQKKMQEVNYQNPNLNLNPNQYGVSLFKNIPDDNVEDVIDDDEKGYENSELSSISVSNAESSYLSYNPQVRMQNMNPVKGMSGK